MLCSADHDCLSHAHASSSWGVKPAVSYLVCGRIVSFCLEGVADRLGDGAGTYCPAAVVVFVVVGAWEHASRPHGIWGLYTQWGGDIISCFGDGRGQRSRGFARVMRAHRVSLSVSRAAACTHNISWGRWWFLWGAKCRQGWRPDTHRVYMRC